MPPSLSLCLSLSLSLAQGRPCPLGLLLVSRSPATLRTSRAEEAAKMLRHATTGVRDIPQQPERDRILGGKKEWEAGAEAGPNDALHFDQANAAWTGAAKCKKSGIDKAAGVTDRLGGGGVGPPKPGILPTPSHLNISTNFFSQFFCVEHWLGPSKI